MRDVPMHEAQYYEYTAKRRIASFGSSYDFESRQLRPADPVPEFLIPLRQRLADWVSLPEDSFAQALVTEYRPGTPLGWHRDALNYDVVAGVSLGRRVPAALSAPTRRARVSRLRIELEPRSMYVMRDEVRWTGGNSSQPHRGIVGRSRFAHCEHRRRDDVSSPIYRLASQDMVALRGTY